VPEISLWPESRSFLWNCKDCHTPTTPLTQ